MVIRRNGFSSLFIFFGALQKGALKKTCRPHAALSPREGLSPSR